MDDRIRFYFDGLTQEGIKKINKYLFKWIHLLPIRDLLNSVAVHLLWCWMWCWITFADLRRIVNWKL